MTDIVEAVMEATTEEQLLVQPLQLLVGNGKNAKYVKGKLVSWPCLQCRAAEETDCVCSVHRDLPWQQRYGRMRLAMAAAVTSCKYMSFVNVYTLISMRYDASCRPASSSRI